MYNSLLSFGIFHLFITGVITFKDQRFTTQPGNAFAIQRQNVRYS